MISFLATCIELVRLPYSPPPIFFFSLQHGVVVVVVASPFPLFGMYERIRGMMIVSLWVFSDTPALRIWTLSNLVLTHIYIHLYIGIPRYWIRIPHL